MEGENIDLAPNLADAEREIAELEQALDDVRRELDAQGAAPGGSLPARVRALAKALRVAAEREPPPAGPPAAPERRKMPDEREGPTFHFVLREAGEYVDGYLTHNRRDDGTLGEIFLRMGKVDLSFASLLHNFATVFSVALQYGVPLQVLVDKCAGQNYPPSGMTNHPAIRNAKSVVDFVARYLRHEYLPDQAAAAGDVVRGPKSPEGGEKEDERDEDRVCDAAVR